MSLFEKYTLKAHTLKNRMVMAPMTRCRAINNVPNDLMATYYAQRAGAGLIISEGTAPSANGLGYARIPGAYTPAQIEGWKNVTDRIHENDGIFFVQLMHCGRITAPQNIPDGGETIAPSPVQAAGEMYTDDDGMVPHPTPRAMTADDLQKTQQEYVDSARLLIERAGVDGVELHAANGYLLDQFLNPKSNLREDIYGGSTENRARFVLEVAQKVVAAIGAEKVGIRISPYGGMNDVASSYDDLVAMYSHLATELRKLGLAYIHIVDHRGSMGAPDFGSEIKSTIKKFFGGTIITGGDIFDKESAQKVLDKGFDLVYCGRAYIANPNLVDKLKEGTDLKEPNPDTFYTAGAEGYTDY